MITSCSLWVLSCLWVRALLMYQSVIFISCCINFLALVWFSENWKLRYQYFIWRSKMCSVSEGSRNSNTSWTPSYVNSMHRQKCWNGNSAFWMTLPERMMEMGLVSQFSISLWILLTCLEFGCLEGMRLQVAAGSSFFLKGGYFNKFVENGIKR